MEKRKKLGRPKKRPTVIVNVKMTELERDDLRRIAIANNCTMSDFLRHCVEREKRRLKANKKWTQETDR